MYISKIRVQNYKAFYDSGWIEFKPGINIISGQNHSGKTAFLEALSLNFENNPHRNLNTLPTLFSKLTQYSQVDIGIFITTKETLKCCRAISSLKGNNLLLILPKPDNNLKVDLIIEELNQKLKSKDGVEIILPFQIDCRLDFVKILENIYCSPWLAFDLYTPEYQKLETLETLDTSKQKLNTIQFELSKSNRLLKDMRTLHIITDIQNTEFYTVDNYHLSDFYTINSLTLIQIKPIIINKIYKFLAERKTIGTYKFENNLILEPDASNLAQVISCLQSRFPSKFNDFIKYVSIVLPHIKTISILPKTSSDGGNEVEIRVWSIDPATNRDDLAFPLEACGTGVGKVLAILYVVISSQEPKIIIIDEPQSFLHPGAAKKLIEILQEFPQHQYFISTHSPSIISAANPSTITLLRYENCEAIPYSMSADDTDEMRSLLAEVGVHLSDVFGSDNILWVEGPTEERCFPLILKKIAKLNLRGTQILAIVNTGDLEGKRSHIIFDVYDKLSGGKVILPPAIGFILDRENKTEKQIEDLKRRSKNEVYFIARRMYENYLLYPEAIAAVANLQENFCDRDLTAEEVEEWIEDKKQKGCYLPRDIKANNLSDDEWLKKVNGAKLLSELFTQFSESRVSYSKTRHSFQLTEWLVSNQPEKLEEIAQSLKEILKRSPEEN